jgi:hypothetical protein
VWRKLMALMEQRNQALMGCLTPTEQGQLIDMFERMLAQAKAEHTGQGDTEAP